MKMSEKIDLLATALSKAQAITKSAIKDATNPFFRSGYSTLDSTWEACRESLTINGLSIIQATQFDPGINMVTLETTLLHSSGQWISSSYPIQPVKNDPQSMGSALSYARRYTLAAMVGITQADDDGNAASHKSHQEKSMPTATGSFVTNKKEGTTTTAVKENQLELKLLDGNNVDPFSKFGGEIFPGKSLTEVQDIDAGQDFKYAKARLKDLIEGKQIPRYALEYVSLCRHDQLI